MEIAAPRVIGGQDVRILGLVVSARTAAKIIDFKIPAAHERFFIEDQLIRNEPRRLQIGLHLIG